MNNIALIIFVVTYIGVAMGSLPGLALDRTGIALLGAIAMVISTVLTTHQAMMAIDIPTILLLYSLMVISAQLRLSGFYTHLALSISRFARNPLKFLAILMVTCAVLSAILANDIVCLAFTPVLCISMLQSKINPVPFLIGLAVSSNIGSAATIIGNPQNMLLGQMGNLSFEKFIIFCILPSVLSLVAAFLILFWLYRGKFQQFPTEKFKTSAYSWPEYNHHQSRKGVLVVIILIIFFFTPLPREITALAMAGLLLCSRSMHTRTILGLIDWHLITLFCALFIIIAGIETTGLPSTLAVSLNSHGINIGNPYILTIFSSILSNLVSNVPATMLITKFLQTGQPLQWYVVALSSTFAGNLITIGSIANLIVIEGAKEYGITLGFKEHAKAGIPITIVSIIITMIWIALNS